MFNVAGLASGGALSICEFTTLTATFEEDLAAYRAAGVGGIGVCEFKLGERSAERLRESGLRATHCIPAVPSILPLPLMEGPDEPEARVEALCASVRRLAELEPVCVVFLTGPGEARRDRPRGDLARSPRRAGGGRPRRARAGGSVPGGRFSFVHTIPDALELIGDEPDVDHARRLARLRPGRNRAVRRSDRRRARLRQARADAQPLRSRAARRRRARLASVFRTLEAGGYDGWYDVEIFSDNGAFGDAFPDSLWDVDAGELARRARESVERVWAER